MPAAKCNCFFFARGHAFWPKALFLTELDLITMVLGHGKVQRTERCWMPKSGITEISRNNSCLNLKPVPIFIQALNFGRRAVRTRSLCVTRRWCQGSSNREAARDESGFAQPIWILSKARRRVPHDNNLSSTFSASRIFAIGRDFVTLPDDSTILLSKRLNSCDITDLRQRPTTNQTIQPFMIHNRNIITVSLSFKPINRYRLNLVLRARCRFHNSLCSQSHFNVPFGHW